MYNCQASIQSLKLAWCVNWEKTRSMYTKRMIEPEIIWYFSWRPVIFTTIWSAAVFLLFYYLNLHTLTLPFLPIATVGTAVAFYIGFKNNSSYDRLWESRKIWGELTNISRALTSYLISVMPPTQPLELKRFVYRQLAYVNMLRLQLRRRNVWDDRNEYTRMSKECFQNAPYEQASEETLSTFCSKEEAAEFIGKQNIACEVLHKQMLDLTRFKHDGSIDDFEHSDMMRMCNDLYAQQGKAERIKTFPFPRQYAFFSEVFVYIFIGLLPFGLIGEFDKLSSMHDWLTVPFTVLIGWVFLTMEKVGDTSENPFEGSLNDIPMTTICRNIEIDLKTMLGEDNLPQPIQAIEHVLM